MPIRRHMTAALPEFTCKTYGYRFQIYKSKNGETYENRTEKHKENSYFPDRSGHCYRCAFGIYRFTRPAAVQGEKTVTIDVIHKDASQKTFEYQTDLEYLGELLTEEGLVSGEEGAYGMFITTVDGETADDTNQEWWCITKDKEKLNTSADQTPIADGEKYELTLTIGY